MLLDERLKGVATFVQTVEAGSFAAAAARLHRTRSAVGKTIARLEQRLGVRLFQRTTRRQHLTEDGAAYYERCRRALAELDAAAAALEAGRREPQGTLRVSAPVLYGRHRVAPVLTALAQRHPRLEIELACSDRPVDLVAEGYDLAVRIGALRDSASLAARRLGAQHYAVCAAPAYLERAGRPASPEDYAGHVAVLYAGPGAEYPWPVRGPDGAVATLAPSARLRYDNLEAVLDAAVAGAGLARLPHWLVAPALSAGTLVLLEAQAQVAPAPIHALWPHGPRLPLRTRVAVDALLRDLSDPA